MLEEDDDEGPSMSEEATSDRDDEFKHAFSSGSDDEQSE